MSVKLFFPHSHRKLEEMSLPKQSREVKYLLSETGSMAATGVQQIAREIADLNIDGMDYKDVAKVIYTKIWCANKIGEKSIRYRGRTWNIVNVDQTKKSKG